MLVKTEGIVIRTLNYGEGSKIITLYTRKMGKVSVLVRGARKTKSRFHAITQLFSYGEYIFFMGRDMGTLNQADLQFPFSDIIKDIEKTAYAAYIVELADKMTEKNEANPFLFQQLLSSLEQINSGKDPQIIANIFEMKILQISGYKPHLKSCIICDSETNINAFSIKRGGLICSLHNEEHTIKIQTAAIKLLRLFERVDINRLGKIDVKEATKNQLQTTMNAFFDEYVGVHLKSKNFLSQLKQVLNSEGDH